MMKGGPYRSAKKSFATFRFLERRSATNGVGFHSDAFEERHLLDCLNVLKGIQCCPNHGGKSRDAMQLYWHSVIRKKGLKMFMKTVVEGGWKAWLKQLSRIKLVSAFVAAGFIAMPTSTRAAFIELRGASYVQDFDSLPSHGAARHKPPGWATTEFGKEHNPILADDGDKSIASAYSYGADLSTDRALGSLQRKGDYGVFGAGFQNSSDGDITRLNISYSGEQWRLGAEGRAADRLQFQYSLDAHSLSSGTWINAPSLDFLTPNLAGVGAHDGNLAANQTQVSSSICFLNIPVGGSFWVRWVDVALAEDGPEDGLAIDDFSITAIPETATLAAGLGMTVLLGYILCKRYFSRGLHIR
jgi:hypothetical protein